MIESCIFALYYFYGKYQLMNSLISKNSNDNEIPIGKRILTIRNQQVLLDRDLAELYGVETKVLNQAVKRNIDRFPSDFRFQLTKVEFQELVTICDRFVTNSKHFKNIFASGKLFQNAVVSKMETAASDGKRYAINFSFWMKNIST